MPEELKPRAPDVRYTQGPEEIKLGQWLWIKPAPKVLEEPDQDPDEDWRDDDDDEDDESEDADAPPLEVEEKLPWLACITHIGTNYVRVTAWTGGEERIHNEGFWDRVDRAESNPNGVIQEAIDEHKEAVKRLLGDIRDLTAKLGLDPKPGLTDGSSSTSLVLGHQDPRAYKTALVKAKEETLPDLFKKVEEENREMALWMKAQLIPLKIQTEGLRKRTEGIEDKIFTIELYAGLCEEAVRIRDGAPAALDEKIHLFQRRHYMDEECLLDYDAGGMSFHKIQEFDRWLLRKGNRDRILPMPKCVVAFQVRRNKKEREAENLGDFLRIAMEEQADKTTYLYMRNGESYYRLTTQIDFGEELFPDAKRSHLMGGQLYIRDWGTKIITESQYQELLAEEAKIEADYQQEIKEWKTMSAAQKKKRPWGPRRQYHGDRPNDYDPLTPNSVYYDDAIQQLARDIQHHNRVAVVLQGILDRSPVFHPHPPWRIYTPEGFGAAIMLVHDETRVITHGDAPDFLAYQQRLNASIRRGSLTVGQQVAWEEHEAKKENDRQHADWRIRSPLTYKRYSPYGNDGPGTVAAVKSIGRDNKACTFEWTKQRLRPKWVRDPENPGYLKPDDSKIGTRFTCSPSRLLHINAYTPGDYKVFYRDPRTRAGYLKWAPLLLAAEDYYADKKAKK